MGNRIFLVSVVAFSSVLWPHVAHANYIDPGAGAMLLQIVFGGVAGIAVVVKIFWHRIVSIFRRNNVEPTDSPVCQRDGD